MVSREKQKVKRWKAIMQNWKNLDDFEKEQMLEGYKPNVSDPEDDRYMAQERARNWQSRFWERKIYHKR